MMNMILHENTIDFNSLERKIYEYGCSVACDILKDCSEIRYNAYEIKG